MGVGIDSVSLDTTIPHFPRARVIDAILSFGRHGVSTSFSMPSGFQVYRMTLRPQGQQVIAQLLSYLADFV
ncbi:hypothetical protein CO676_03950 [Sinorhizobium sp. BJ1]|nr:hypothetical protein CO676_03950 [Sinorhizobium sp. BJ1]